MIDIFSRFGIKISFCRGEKLKNAILVLETIKIIHYFGSVRLFYFCALSNRLKLFY